VATKVERWVAMDQSEHDTERAADDHDIICTATTMCLAVEQRIVGALLLSRMQHCGYQIIPPQMVNAE